MHNAVRLWPLTGVVAMLLLGWAVGRGSTAVDDWFEAHLRGPGRPELAMWKASLTIRAMSRASCTR